MAQFHQPAQQPYNVFRPVGPGNIKSRYLPNDYYVEFTPSFWRQAIDQAILYSNLVWYDMMCSWCVQSSPFLVSQINKRLIPLQKTRFAFVDANGNVNEKLTAQVMQIPWWKELSRNYLLSLFYGVRLIGIDMQKQTAIDFPMRNIDIINKALRNMTYGIESVVNVDEFDNMFYFQPNADQDFKLGMFQPISRAMIGIVEAYNNWSVTSATYSFPRSAIYYLDGNPQYKQVAMDLARNMGPLDIAVLPGRQNLEDKSFVPAVDIKPQQTQMYPDAFRVFKEYIETYRAEIMQLVTGGTLLGATEKNTNSESLADIHYSLYEDICQSDVTGFTDWINLSDTKGKLSRLLNIPDLEEYTLQEMPAVSITLNKFEKAVKAMSQIGLQPTPEFFAKVGLEANDINTGVRNQNWVNTELQKKTMSAKIKETLSKITSTNGRRKGAEGESADNPTANRNEIAG